MADIKKLLQAGFLIELGDGTFFTRWVDTYACATPYPSRALHLGYATADQFCQELRARGYKDSIVVDRFGAPVADPLSSRAEPNRAAYKRFWGQESDEPDQSDWPKTRAEFDSTPTSTILRMCKADKKFAEHVKQFQNDSKM